MNFFWYEKQHKRVGIEDGIWLRESFNSSWWSQTLKYHRLEEYLIYRLGHGGNPNRIGTIASFQYISFYFYFPFRFLLTLIYWNNIVMGNTIYDIKFKLFILTNNHDSNGNKKYLKFFFSKYKPRKTHVTLSMPFHILNG